MRSTVCTFEIPQSCFSEGIIPQLEGVTLSKRLAVLIKSCPKVNRHRRGFLSSGFPTIVKGGSLFRPTVFNVEQGSLLAFGKGIQVAAGKDKAKAEG